MEELVTKDSTHSSVCRQAIQEMVRHHIEPWLQGLLEDQVTGFLGRARCRRRREGERAYRQRLWQAAAADHTRRHGDGALAAGARASGTALGARLPPLFARRTPSVNDLRGLFKRRRRRARWRG